MQIDWPGERVEIALEARPFTPTGEADAELVGGVAGRHPLRLGDAEMIEHRLELRGRAFAYADNADFRAFDDGDLAAAITPAVMQQASGDPPGAASAENDYVRRRVLAHSPLSAISMTKPPARAMCTSSVSPCRTVTSRTFIAWRSSPMPSAPSPSSQMVATYSVSA